MILYIVYSYILTYGGGYPPVKYIEGVYNKKEDAIQRKEAIEENKVRVSFINVVPYGDCHVELFTTGL